jgi:hypothetical protein
MQSELAKKKLMKLFQLIKRTFYPRKEKKKKEIEYLASVRINFSLSIFIYFATSFLHSSTSVFNLVFSSLIIPDLLNRSSSSMT